MRALVAVALIGCSGGPESTPIGDNPPPCGESLVAPGGACPERCTECDGNICKIACASGECNDTTIECPADFACEITCDGLDSCDTTTIECPTDFACAVSCRAYDACGDVVLRCGRGTCSMTCNGDSESCGGSLMDCSAGGACTSICNGSGGPAMDCGGACACDDGC